MKTALSIAGTAMAMLSLAGCSQSPAEREPGPAAGTPSIQQADASAAAYNHDRWIGRWIGVEGMFVDIQPAGEGTYQVEMQSDLDTRGTYTGTSTAEGIAFTRGGQTLTLRQSNGAETGLKWLDGKQDCLMVAAGEGYCRD